MIRYFIFIISILISAVYAQKADKPASTAQKEITRQTWVIATSLPNKIESPLNILAEEKLSELVISKRIVGPAIKVPKDGIIQVVKRTEPKQGEILNEILASVKIPEDIKESLIILVPDSTLDPPLMFKSHVVDLNKFRVGHGLFINLTKFEIGVTLGNDLTSIPADQFEIVKIAEIEGTESIPISYKYRPSKDKDWSLISASSVSQRNSTREILIFSYDTELNEIGYHGMNFNMIK